MKPTHLTCFLCGTVSPQKSVRVGFFKRAHNLAQSCPKCDYCALDLKEVPGLEPATIKKLVSSRRYQVALRDKEIGEPFGAQLCWSYLCEESQDFYTAGKATVLAARLADRAKRPLKAALCRERAIALFRQPNSGPSGNYLGGSSVDPMLLIELNRSAGRLKEADELCRTWLLRMPPPDIYHYICRQSNLIERGDTRPLRKCYEW